MAGDRDGTGSEQPDQPEQQEPGTPEPASPEATSTGPETPAEPPAQPGRIRRQEPGVTAPRPPTVAEARARDRARRKQEELEAARLAAEAKRRKRNRRLIGGAAVVGVVAVVALIYTTTRSQTVTAHCVLDENGQEVVVEDRYCSGTPGMGGIFILGGHQYRYYYGGNATIGQRPTGGSTVLPKGAEVKTKSGTVIQRGGLGSKSSGTSGS